jgi:hypothetical protein
MIPTWLQERLQVFADPRFRFIADAHEYYLAERQLTPFSTWIKDYKEAFDEPGQARRTADKRGISVEEVLAGWERSRWVGTKTHEFIEAHYQATCPAELPEPELDAEVILRCKKFLGLRTGRLQNYRPAALELKLFHEPSGLCGTLDFLGWHESSQQLYVLDWKTSTKIGTDRDPVWRRMYEPFADLADHEQNVYSLQISFYRLLLEQAGIPTAGGAIVHLPTGHQPAQLYPAIDYRDRVRALIF